MAAIAEYTRHRVRHYESSGELRTIDFDGRVLGWSSSEGDRHINLDQHTDGHAAKGVRCSACRWFEVTIYETSPSERAEFSTYLVWTRGSTNVPGEVPFDKVTWVDSPLEIIEVLTVRQDGRPSIPKPSARALAQAADRSETIRNAYLDRAV